MSRWSRQQFETDALKPRQGHARPGCCRPRVPADVSRTAMRAGGRLGRDPRDDANNAARLAERAGAAGANNAGEVAYTQGLSHLCSQRWLSCGPSCYDHF
jgi:hypothetical protein